MVIAVKKNSQLLRREIELRKNLKKRKKFKDKKKNIKHDSIIR
jgi:hypothetical protein